MTDPLGPVRLLYQSEMGKESMAGDISSRAEILGGGNEDNTAVISNVWIMKFR